MYAHQLPFQLCERTARELLVLEFPEDDIYVFRKNQFAIIFNHHQKITKEDVKNLIVDGITTVFVSVEDNERIEENLLDRLRHNARSLSVGGSPLKNSLQHVSLMTMNMQNLYDSPLNDEILKLLYQSSGNLVGFANEHKKIVNKLFHKMQIEPFHYSRLQPMLSSVMLLGFLHYLKTFSSREIENLFVTSYLKDLGMCYVQKDSLDKEELDQHDKRALKVHPYNTLLLIENRLPINKSQLEIITHHHFLNDKIAQVRSGDKLTLEDDMAYGLETYLVAVFDVITAMISERPYRKPVSIFECLDLIRAIMAERYPLEFKALVHYLKNFFKE